MYRAHHRRALDDLCPMDEVATIRAGTGYHSLAGITNAQAHDLADWHRIRIRWPMDLGSRGRESVLLDRRAGIYQL